MNQIKIWPHMTIVAILVAVLAGLGVAVYMRHEQTAAAQELPYEARIQRVDGDVAFSENLPNVDTNQEQWVAATANQPFSVGDRIYTRDKSRASLAFSGRNFARLDPNTSLDVIALEDNRTQLALREGSALFDVGYLEPGELFEVGTPYGAVDFNEPGLYNVGFDDNGGVLVSALSGVAQVVGLAGSGQVSKGELLTLLGTTAAQVALSRLNGNDASYLVDDYYRYQYPNTYDGRYYDNYDAYLSDPYYYDPYRRDVSYQYVNYDLPGVNDLSYYGDWQSLDGYGYAWSPRVDTGWAPYQEGYWVNDYPYGLTWVSSEPWGYTPYHYGRWTASGGRWFWIPDSINSAPAYSPALVAFVPFSDANQIGWVPLGPGDPYAYRYYDNNWQPRYLTSVDTTPVRLVNLAIPEAVTVVSLDGFGRDIDRRNIRRIDRNMLASVRPTLEPLTLTPLRNAVVHSAWGRGKKDLPPGIARKLRETPVFVADAPRQSRFARFDRDVAREMRVERVPDQARKQKFQVRDDRRAGDNPAAVVDQNRQAFEQQNRQRQQQIDGLKAEAARGNRQAGRQARQLEQQNRQAQQQQARQLEQQNRQVQQQQVRQRQEQAQQVEEQRRNQARGQAAAARVQAQAARAQAEAARAHERAQRRAAQRPEGLRVGNPAPKAERRQPQPRPQAQPRYQLPPRQEVRQQQRVERQQAQPRPQQMQRQQPQRQQAQPRPQQMQRQERPQPQPRAERPQPQPRQQVQQQPQPQQQSQGAAKRQERQQQPAAQPGGQGQGGGKGKGKKP